MYIETRRMCIRDFLTEDAADLYAILGNPEVMEKCEPAYSFAKTAEFLSAFCIGRKGAVAAVHKESGRVIGYLLFHMLDEGVYETGWFFNRDYWRHGYAYEACRALIDDAFRERNAHKLFAETIDPVKSVGMMKKLGMRPEGIQRAHVKDAAGNWADLYLYGLLREDWEDQRSEYGI